MSSSTTDRRTSSVAWAVATIVVALVIAFIAWLAMGNQGDGEASTAAPSRTTDTSETPASEPSDSQGSSAEATVNEPSPEVQQMLLEMARRDADDPMATGSVDAPVVMIEYADYRCPYCAQFHLQVRPELQSLVDDGTLRVEFRDLVLFEEASQLAALGARAAAEQGMRDEFQDAVFGLSAQGSADYGRTEILDLAAEIGVPDLAAFEADLDDPALLAAVQADTAEAKGIGVTSTPTFLINTQVVRGAQPAPVFAQVIAQEEQKALAAAQE